jgi:hypothetical protein
MGSLLQQVQVLVGLAQHVLVSTLCLHSVAAAVAVAAEACLLVARQMGPNHPAAAVAVLHCHMQVSACTGVHCNNI